jgi:hypothetical protein
MPPDMVLVQPVIQRMVGLVEEQLEYPVEIQP